MFGISEFVLFISVIVILTGVLGVLRFNDFFSRLHPSGMIDSLGIHILIIGFCFHIFPDFLTIFKCILLMSLIFTTSPLSCYLLSRTFFEDSMANLKYISEDKNK